MKSGFALIAFGVMAAAASPQPSRVTARLPLRFEENHGGYVARGPGFEMSVEPAENRIRWNAVEIRTRLAGANGQAQVEPEGKLPGLANYFLGDAKHWRTNVVGYGRLRTRNVYPGIDLVFHGENGRLEYDFLVAARSNPAAIRLELSGQTGLRVDDAGDLVIQAGEREIQWKRPDVYQESEGKRIPVSGRFAVSGRSIGFEIGAYDKTRALVIDPALSYGTYVGGSGNDIARGIGLDAAGNVYVAGGTTSGNLPVLSAYQTSYHGQAPTSTNFVGGDAFVAKFSPAGVLMYLTYLGGAADDAATSLAVDPAGNAYLTGFTVSTDFPVTAGSYQGRFGGAGGRSFTMWGDAFAAKLSPTGNQLLYSTYLGGSEDDIGTAIAIDSKGDAFITGSTISANFPTTTGAYQTTLKGGNQEPVEPCCGGPFINSGDAFVTELNPAGSALVFSTLVGGSSDDMAWTIALDSASNIYIGGFTLSPDFPTTPGAYQRNYGGAEPQTPYFVTGDGFITKLNAAGTALVFSTYFGGTGDEFITGIAVDSGGNVYFTGYSSTMNLPTTPGAPQRSYAGYTILPFAIEYLSGDAIVGKFNASGSALTYLTYLGGSMNDGAFAIAIDAAGNAYVTGFTDSTNFPVTANALQPKFAGDGGSDPYFLLGDAFLTVVNPTGTGWVYSSYYGGSHDDVGLGIALDPAGHVYIAGNTFSSDLPITPGAEQQRFGGAIEGFPELWGDGFYSQFALTQAGPAPVITSVANAEGQSPTIAPNTWVLIEGSGLANDTRPWEGSDFLNGQMPTELDGASATFNGTSGYVYYISPTEMIVLTPEGIGGTVNVKVTNNGAASQLFAAPAQPVSPSFFVYDGTHIAATHMNGTAIGPISLYPGVTTPAQPGEEVLLYANGFGPTTVAVVAGSRVQSGSLSPLPVVMIGNSQATVDSAGLISPGVFQFKVVVPQTAANGDISIKAGVSGASTQGGVVITVMKP